MRLSNILRSKKSVLFINPDYHSTFFLRSELRKLGWKADIYVPLEYPIKFLYSTESIKQPYFLNLKHDLLKVKLNTLLQILWFFSNIWRYEFHIYYGRPPAWFILPRYLNKLAVKSKSFDLSLSISKFFGCTLIYLPSGCHDEFLKAEFMSLDNGHVCNNCGFSDRCNDDDNSKNLIMVRKYFKVGIGNDPWPTKHYSNIHLRRKCIDLDLWSPSINLPVKYLMAPSKNVRILHSFSLSNRSYLGRNIKGSPYISQAVTRLKDEGYNVELINITDISSAEIRFYQVQADIVVEQLIYGWWGSTGVEAMALGKPVVCYLRPSWKEYFFDTFPEYSELPIIEANINNIYEVLLSLITDVELRKQAGVKSRIFAEKHFDPKINSKSFENFLLNLI